MGTFIIKLWVTMIRLLVEFRSDLNEIYGSFVQDIIPCEKFRRTDILKSLSFIFITKDFILEKLWLLEQKMSGVWNLGVEFPFSLLKYI